MREDVAYFIVNDETDEFHVNALGHDSRFAQYVQPGCNSDKIKNPSYGNDFVALVIKGKFPCGHCIGRLASRKH